MSDQIRLLNDDAIETFRVYLRGLESNPTAPPPFHMLTDATTSTEASFSAVIDREPQGKPFASRYEFGKYLAHVLSAGDSTAISREHRLWTWLALYYFDQLCPLGKNGGRKPLDDAAYILEAEFKWTKYYRHFVRTAWVAVMMHPEQSRVLLTPLRDHERPLAQRGELIEQIASRQSLFRSRTVITAADRLYYDSELGRPRKGAGGSEGGSPRRFAAVLNQFDLTYDLESVTPNTVIERLPKEFGKWRKLLASEPESSS